MLLGNVGVPDYTVLHPGRQYASLFLFLFLNASKRSRFSSLSNVLWTAAAEDKRFTNEAVAY
jgi:hypothetical protein